jgi:hypothetical protein
MHLMVLWLESVLVVVLGVVSDFNNRCQLFSFSILSIRRWNFLLSSKVFLFKCELLVWVTRSFFRCVTLNWFGETWWAFSQNTNYTNPASLRSRDETKLSEADCTNGLNKYLKVRPQFYFVPVNPTIGIADFIWIFPTNPNHLVAPYFV